MQESGSWKCKQRAGESTSPSIDGTLQRSGAGAVVRETGAGRSGL